MPQSWTCEHCRRTYAPHVDYCQRCDGAIVSPATSAAPKATEPTVGELWEEYEVWGKNNYRPGAWHVALMHRRNFAKVVIDGVPVADMPWSKATPHFAEQYRAARGAMPNGRKGTIKPGTINRELTTLQQMFNYFVHTRKTIERNPIDGFSRVDEAQFARQTYLSPGQVRRFLESGPPVFQDIGLVAYRCAGLRNSEARLLKKTEIDWEARKLNLSAARNKNHRPREVPFPQDVEAVLRRHCENSRGPFVFVSPTDPQRVKPIPVATMQGWLRQARKRSGVQGFDGEPVVVHTLRHSGVTQLIQDGAPQGFVRAAAGMSEQTFARYLKFGREQQNALRKIMDRQVDGPTPIAPEDRRGPQGVVSPGSPDAGFQRK